MVLLQVVVTLEAARNELCVVDEAIAVRVHYVHKVSAVVLCHGASRNFLNSNLELFNGQLAISVLIKLRESVAQCLDLVLRDSRSDQGKGSALEILGLNVIAHVLYYINGNGHLLFLLLTLSLDPGVIEGLFSSETHVCLSLEQLANQILSFVGDLLPHTR